MASNLPPNPDSSKPSNGSQDSILKAAPAGETDASQKPREKDLASFVTTHSTEVLSQTHGTTVPASARFNLTPANSEAAKDPSKHAVPNVASSWAPPKLGFTPPKPSWAPPASAQPAPSQPAGAGPPKATPGWSPPKIPQNFASAKPAAEIQPPQPSLNSQTPGSTNGSSSVQGFAKPLAPFGSAIKPTSQDTVTPSSVEGQSQPKPPSTTPAAAPFTAASPAVPAPITKPTPPVASESKPISVPSASKPIPAPSVPAVPKPIPAPSVPAAPKPIPVHSVPAEPKAIPTPSVPSAPSAPVPAAKPAPPVASAPFIKPTPAPPVASAPVVKPSPAPPATATPIPKSTPPVAPAPKPEPAAVSKPAPPPAAPKSAATPTLAPKKAQPDNDASSKAHGSVAPPSQPEPKSETKVDPLKDTAAPSEEAPSVKEASPKKSGRNLSVSFGEVNKDTPPPAAIKAGAVPSKPSIKPHPKRPLSPTKDDKAAKAKPAKAPKTVTGVPSRSTRAGKAFVLKKADAGFQPVAGLADDIVDICCGTHHTLALTAAGEVFSWGSNAGKALGRDGPEDVPTKVEFETPVEIVQITAGGDISAVLTSTGDVFAWGTFYSNGEVLGFVGTPNESQETPLKLSAKLPRNTQFMSVAAGKNHILLLTTKGKVYVSGDAEFGQLGVRMLRSRGGDDIPQGLRLNVISLTNVVSISAGGHHSFAINKKGEVYGWGLNKYLQCGIPFSGLEFEVSLELPGKSQALTALSPQKIVSGDHHTLVLTDANEIHGVGLNSHGQLGSSGGSFTSEDGKPCADTPVAVALPGAKTELITSGPNHCLAYSAPDVYIWGSDVGGSVKKVQPIQGHKIISLTAGDGFSMAIASDEDSMQ